MRPRRQRAIHSYRLGEDALLYDARSATAHAVNHSAMAVWELCDGRRTVVEIAQELAEWLGRDRDDLYPDVVQGVAEFARLGLLEAT